MKTFYECGYGGNASIQTKSDGAAVLEDVKEFAKQDPREIFLGVIQDAGSLYLRDLLQSEGTDNA